MRDLKLYLATSYTYFKYTVLYTYTYCILVLILSFLTPLRLVSGRLHAAWCFFALGEFIEPNGH